jgi:hypothetical protein
MAKAKGTRVTQREKNKMYELYQVLGSYSLVAKKMRRCPSTVARYVSEIESAVKESQVTIAALTK